jgi:Ion channel
MKALLLGIPVLVSTLTVQATAVITIVRFVSALVRRGLGGRRFWLDVAIMMVALLITLASILAQIAIWAASLIACGEFGDFNTAFYHSAVNFTTLGYGDIVMSRTWRLLGPLEAVNGILMCGITASALFTVANRLINLRLERHEQG